MKGGREREREIGRGREGEGEGGGEKCACVGESACVPESANSIDGALRTNSWKIGFDLVYTTVAITVLHIICHRCIFRVTPGAFRICYNPEVLSAIFQNTLS